MPGNQIRCDGSDCLCCVK